MSGNSLDTQASIPRYPLRLSRVGLRGVRKPLEILRPDRVAQITASFDIFVDLPADRRGSDLSRDSHALASIVDETVVTPVSSFEGVCRTLVDLTMEKHPYSSFGMVRAEGELFLKRGTETRTSCFESYRLFAEATRQKRSSSKAESTTAIGVEVVGMTACPCAMEGCRELLLTSNPNLSTDTLRAIPIISHNQRNRTRLMLTFGEENSQVDVLDLIDIVAEAQSAPTVSVLKRPDEAALVLRAHQNPRFVEDVARMALALCAMRLADLPGETLATVYSESEESIHQHDVRVEHSSLFKEIRAQLAAGQAPRAV